MNGLLKRLHLNEMYRHLAMDVLVDLLRVSWGIQEPYVDNKIIHRWHFACIFFLCYDIVLCCEVKFVPFRFQTKGGFIRIFSHKQQNKGSELFLNITDVVNRTRCFKVRFKFDWCGIKNLDHSNITYLLQCTNNAVSKKSSWIPLSFDSCS